VTIPSDREILVSGSLLISAPDDDFLFEGGGESGTLTGPSLGAFLRLRKQINRSHTPAPVHDYLRELTCSGRFCLSCYCRNHRIATVTTGPNGVKAKPDWAGVVRSVFRRA
jgi:hypothetical protein